ncbi:MAG: transcriptional regulator [Bacteroidota bacterium]
MEKYILEKDIKVFCVTAESFPDGILAAFQKVHSLIPDSYSRTTFGISFPDRSGNIIYKAAVEESFEGEAEKLGCESFTIEKGEYLSILIKNYMKDIPRIGKAFQTLISDPRIDPNGVCVEKYLNANDLLCLVKIN